MSFEHKRDFCIVGVVERTYVSPKGGFASLRVESTRERRTVRHDCKVFDKVLIERVRSLGGGMTVELIGSVGTEKLTNKDETEVKQNGFTVWSPLLVVTEIKVEGSSVAAKEPEDDRPNLDDIPF